MTAVANVLDSPPVLREVLTSVDLVCAANVKPRAIRWLWPGWMAKGKLAILAGVGGTGKTTLALGLAAVITTAGRWPDGLPCRDCGNVLIWSAEDDPADTIVPRLIAAGADLNRAHIIRGAVTPDGESLPFDPARDVPMLHRKAGEIGGAALLIVDPIVSAVAGDMHRANDVRRSLQALVDFGAAFDCAVIGITHFSKGSKGSSPADRVIGSQAFGALARMVLVAAKQEDGDSRVLARAKSNIGRDDGGFTYSLEQVALQGGGIEASRVVWGEAVEGSARDILGEVETGPDDGAATEREDAEQFLCDLLADGPVPSNQVKSDAVGAGYSWATIRRAQRSLGIKAVKEGGAFGDGKQQWLWRLPDSGVAEGAHRAQKVLIKNREHLQENLSTFSETTPAELMTEAEEFDL